MLSVCLRLKRRAGFSRRCAGSGGREPFSSSRANNRIQPAMREVPVMTDLKSSG